MKVNFPSHITYYPSSLRALS